MSSDKIPGVPEGWELVRIDRPAKGDWFIDVAGQPKEYHYETNCGGVFPIIRKIEKPAKYRPFKDAEEYLPHWGKPICLKDGSGFDSVVSTDRIGVYIAAGNTTRRYSMADAFDLFEFADGTPFGVKIDE
jgi:hypothetical protein